MNERDFELLLQEDISALPPTDALTHTVNPWRKAMNRILWGLAMVTVTLNFLNLDTILPAIGMLLMLLGFRALRRENGWFRAGFFLVILRALSMLVSIFFGSTIYAGTYSGSETAILVSYATLPLGFAHLVCLRNGIRAVQKKAGMDPHGGNAILVFYVIMTLLALVNFQGYTVWLILIAYICILRGLFKLSGELEDAGYAITAAPTIVQDHAISIAYTAVIALLLAIGYTGFSQYAMDWALRTDKPDSQIHQELLELGFPEYVLNDLTEEEIQRCRNAAKVYVDTEDLPASDGYEVYEERSDGTYIYTDYKARELRITAVAVEPKIPEDDWLIIHHFLWTEYPGYRGTEAMQIWPTYMKNEGWAKAGHLSGRVLYDDGAVTYTAPYRRLEELCYSYTGFFGPTESTDIIATFSLPRKGENCRGYVCYSVKEVEEGWLLNSWCNYFYQQTFLQFPVRTAEDAVLSHNFGYSKAIKANQTAIQMSQDERNNYHVIGGE